MEMNQAGQRNAAHGVCCALVVLFIGTAGVKCRRAGRPQDCAGRRPLRLRFARRWRPGFRRRAASGFESNR
ncbi:MAG TPA: hypothetical protein VFE78_15425, partial [Gemmataceae bacterium]|nr:hypothetical protein [Gemmataceae bacterium]